MPGNYPWSPPGGCSEAGCKSLSWIRGLGTLCCLESCWIGVWEDQWVLSMRLWMDNDSTGEWINLASLCKQELPCQYRMGWQSEPVISGSRKGLPPIFWEVCLGGAGPAWCSMCQISIVGDCFKTDLAKPVLMSYHIKLVTEAGNC